MRSLLLASSIRPWLDFSAGVVDQYTWLAIPNPAKLPMTRPSG